MKFELNYSINLSVHPLISFLYFHIVKKTKWSNQTPDNFVIKTKKKIKKKISKLFINISISPYLNINAQICDLKIFETKPRVKYNMIGPSTSTYNVICLLISTLKEYRADVYYMYAK